MNVQTPIENHLICPVIAFNAALGTSRRFPPPFVGCSMKTNADSALSPQVEAKTELPRFVSGYRDRHGKMRYRFRRKTIDCQISAAPGSIEFAQEYASLLNGCRPKREKDDPKNCVYFVSDGHAIKIGYASNPKARMRAHQTSCPRRLRLMAVARGGMGLERLYHERFAEHRIRGEWFRIHDDILAEVARLRLKRPGPARLSNRAAV